MTLEELIMQRKTLKEIAEFLDIGERTIASMQNRNKVKPSHGSPLNYDYEDIEIAKESKNEWQNFKKKVLYL